MHILALLQYAIVIPSEYSEVCKTIMKKMKGRNYCLNLMRAAGVPVSDPQMTRVFKRNFGKTYKK